MKKVLVVSLIALTLSACSSFTGSTGTSKLTLKQCLMDEGQKQVLNGKLTNSTLTAVAKEVAATCATKLALGGTSTETVQLATEVLKALVQ